MDNLYEYILVIFLIISFLNGIFGKKKKKEQQARQREQEARPVPSGNKSRKSDRDTLEEILGIKLPIPEEEKEERAQVRGNQSWNPEEEFRAESPKPQQRQVQREFRKSSEQITAEKRLERAKREIEKKKAEVYDIDTLIPLPDNSPGAMGESKRITALRKKLQQPDSMRDIIIAAEILKRPGKFRR